MQLIYWCMNKITPEKYRTIIYLILTAVIMIWNEEIKSYPTIFMFNNAVQWLPYFIIGNLFGLKLSRLILDYPSKYIIVLTTLVAFIGLQAIDCNLPAYFFLKAGKPMPESELLYPDVGQEERDMDLQHAARWAMENELIPDLNDEGTAPEEMKFFQANPVSKFDVLNAWQKAQELKNN